MPDQPHLITRLLELIRFSHTVFALPFAALASAWALAVPTRALTWSWPLVVTRLAGVVVCMVAARSAAMAINRLADARYDADNPRTAGRHIPAGLLTVMQVGWFLVASCLLFLAGTLLFLPNWLPLVLAVPVLLWICGYSYAKRFTSLAHLWLGVALALSPVSAWIAMRGEEVMLYPGELIAPLILGVAIACWVTGFDIIYACQDADYDRRMGLHSLPATLGVPSALRLAAVCHLLMWLVLAALPSLVPQLHLGYVYYCALLVVGLLLVRQHAIVKPSDLTRVNEAFFTINAVISLGLSLVAAVDAWIWT